MQIILYKYLALYKSLNIPGIGSFTINQTPAALQFTDKRLQPPQSSIAFTQAVHPTNNHFYTFLSREWEVEKVVAIRKYKEEVEGMMEQIKQEGICELQGIGTLRKDKDSNIIFKPDATALSFYSTLPAERVVRKRAQHTVLVGEHEHIKEYTSPDTEKEIVLEEEPAKEKWKTFALVIAIVAVLLIVLYYATLVAN